MEVGAFVAVSQVGTKEKLILTHIRHPEGRGQSG